MQSFANRWRAQRVSEHILWISFLSFFMCLRSKLIISFRRDNDSGVFSIFVFSCYGGCRNGKPWKTGFMYAFLFFTSLDGVYRCCLVVPSSRKVVYNKQCAQCRELCKSLGLSDVDTVNISFVTFVVVKESWLVCKLKDDVH